jgi:oxygen-independent coproporphyrinogen-3 oxidase
MDTANIPLSLYVHFPWCVRKCPYCDFNSHELPEGLDEGAYVDAVLRDLEVDTALVAGRRAGSVFFGGGTPSLLSGPSLARLLEGIRDTVGLEAGAEITLEANPGAVDSEHFAAYREAGVNRLSIGVQSFDDGMLAALGRIHTAADAVAAFRSAQQAGFDQINLDLMFGLPRQDADGVAADVRQAVELEPAHLSWYQLTIEPHTAFAHATPPGIPDDEALWVMHEAGCALLDAAGYRRYEVSAWAQPGSQCRHNRNYWEFGDYIGVGAGAHGKLTLDDRRIERRRRERHPEAYMRGATEGTALSGTTRLQDEDLVLEFMMNALRLEAGVPAGLLEARTGLKLEAVHPRIALAVEQGLLEPDAELLCATDLGRRHLNGLLNYFV